MSGTLEKRLCKEREAMMHAGACSSYNTVGMAGKHSEDRVVKQASYMLTMMSGVS